LRKLLTFSLVLLFSLHAVAVETVSVKELEQRIFIFGRKSDRKAANEIAGLKLKERLSYENFVTLSHALPGERSREALTAVADASEFLGPPPAEILPLAGPPPKQQGEILLHAIQFVSDESKRMPNFLAERATTRFQDAVPYPYSARIRYVTPGSFHRIDSHTAGVRYLGGKEEELLAGNRPKKELVDATQLPLGLTTWGEFGPLLETVVADILQSKAGWDHWERAGADRLAVFRFFVPQEKSHYMVEYCCSMVRQDNKFTMTEFKATPAYQGTITIDPVTGHVARIVLICDLAPGQVISRADVELEYGPVAIAGQEYVLPLRGVSASTTAATQFVPLGDTGYLANDRYVVTSINDLQFENYRVFRTEMKILPQETPAKATD
jgi:hypothetical protein